MMTLEQLSPSDIRKMCRNGQWVSMTADAAPGFYQANLVILPADQAVAFRRFCERNRAPCPIIDVTEPGNPEPKIAARGADLRTDLPLYEYLVDGKVEERCTDIRHLWQDDHVAFLLGCSFSLDGVLKRAGFSLPHMYAVDHIAAYVTTIDCETVDYLAGPMICSMRPVPEELVEDIHALCSLYPLAHGTPVHCGNPAEIGVNLKMPDYAGRIPLPVPEGHVPMLWGCGITPQIIAQRSGIKHMIVHAPGHMFITDMRL